MQTEIEKKYIFLQSDYEKIIGNCKKEDSENLKDYYLDDNNLTLLKNNYYLRLRNGVYELKITTKNKDSDLIISKEIIGDEKIDDILKKEFGFYIDDTSGVLFVDTYRENFSYIIGNQKINICIDSFQHGKRYEIEVMSEDKEKAERAIEKFRLEIGLEAISDDESSYKILVCARNQNMEIYEILKG